MLAEADSPEQFARDLQGRTWTLCTGFQCGSYLFLNDSTSENGAQEIAVVVIRDHDFLQIESGTFSWATPEQALNYVKTALSGAWDHNDFAKVVYPRLQRPAEHGRCPLCP